MREVRSRPVGKVATLRGTTVVDALLRAEHADARQLRSRRQIAGRGRGEPDRVERQLSVEKGEIAHRHGSHAGAIGADLLVMRHGKSPARPTWPRPQHHRRGHQRRRRHARPPDAGAARPVHDAPPPRRPRRQEGRHRRRRHSTAGLPDRTSGRCWRSGANVTFSAAPATLLPRTLATKWRRSETRQRSPSDNDLRRAIEGRRCGDGAAHAEGAPGKGAHPIAAGVHHAATR
jgi:hypothetical protein